MPEQDSSFVISDTISRLRLLERRQDTIREKLLIVNQNMVEEYKKLIAEVHALNADIIEIKDNMVVIQDTIRNIVKDTDSFARKEQLKVLEKYINLWNPLNFITEEEVKRLIKKRSHGTRKKVPKRKHRRTISSSRRRGSKSKAKRHVK